MSLSSLQYRDYKMIITMILILIVVNMIAVAAMYMHSDMDDIVRERELTISKCGLNRKGERTVTVWTVKTKYLPFRSKNVIHIQVPSAEAYEQVRLYGSTKFITKYVKKRKWFTITDSYTEIKMAY